MGWSENDPRHTKRHGTRKLLGEAARVLSAGGKYMIFSAFGNDGFGHKDMAEMLSHPGFGGELQVHSSVVPPSSSPCSLG